MQTIKTDIIKPRKFTGGDFTESLWEKSWTYIRTVVDVVREPVLILDKDLRVMAANEPFYSTFGVKASDTENKTVYELGNGQWDIPALRKLLNDILTKDTFFKGLEVDHAFPLIGQKIMILNARRIYFNEDTISEQFPPIILLAIEDVTEMMSVAKKLAQHTNNMEAQLASQTKKLETHIAKLEKEIDKIKNSSQK
jgi:nitrogen-specific signal transduction histidine kinase